MTDTAGATYDTKSEGLEDPTSFVKLWLDALRLAEDEEKEWLKRAEETANTFRGKAKSKGRHFNIFHSNVETICPALYNSTPEPDVRRRYSDADPIGKVVADLLERSLSYSVDSYDFDHVMKSVVKDGEIVGRGVPRVRYVPTLGQTAAPSVAVDAEQAGEAGAQPAPAAAAPGQPPAPEEELIYQEVLCEYVPWRYFRRGPGRVWPDVPWLAFGDFLTREALHKLCGDAKDKNGELVAEKVPLNYTADKKEGARKAGAQEQSIFRRALVWQIWDKEARKVVSICPDYADGPLAMVEDPLGLRDFFPVPRPYQPILTTDSLIPIVPYEIYEDLVDELNDITRRIGRLIKQLRPRALYGGEASDIQALAAADDGELIPATKIDAFLQSGGLEKALAWWPLDPIVKALQALVVHRNEIKQVIYEVTGTSDILRGATEASETATAQQIKAQWGSLRIQDRQTEVARVARDLFRLKSEIIASKFTFETLSEMTGIKPATAEQKAQAQQIIAAYQQQQSQPPAPAMPGSPPVAPPQPPPPEVEKAASEPSQEEVEQVLRSDISRSYRIDIESDSTIRGDLTRNQQTMNLFLQGTAQFAAAMGPIIALDKTLLQPAIEVYTAFARQFKLGKQAEDALDGLADTARKAAAQPQQPQTDPRAETEKVKAAATVKKIEMESVRDERKHGIKMAEMDREAQAAEHELAIAGHQAELDERAAITGAALAPLPVM